MSKKIKWITLAILAIIGIFLLGACSADEAEPPLESVYSDMDEEVEYIVEMEDELDEELEEDENINAEQEYENDLEAEYLEAFQPSAISLFDDFGYEYVSGWLRTARHRFEQIMLPDIVFGFESLIILAIESDDASILENGLPSVWHDTILTYVAEEVMSDLIQSLDEDSPNYMMEALDVMEQTQEIVAIISEMYDEHIIDISIERLGEDTGALIIKLYYTGWIRISSYIGIVYNETLGLMYFTLERTHEYDSDGVPIYFFCWVYDFRQGQRGSLMETENNREAFIDAIMYTVQMGLEWEA